MNFRIFGKHFIDWNVSVCSSPVDETYLYKDRSVWRTFVKALHWLQGIKANHPLIAAYLHDTDMFPSLIIIIIIYVLTAII